MSCRILPRALILAVVLVAGSPSSASAQALWFERLDAERPSAVAVGTGFSGAFVAGLGYAHAVDGLGHRAIVDAELDVPWVEIDGHDWRLRAGIAMPFSIAGRWCVLPRIAPTLRASANEVADLIGVGVDVAVVAGYVAPRWSIGAELGFDAALVTHVTPTPAYRMAINDGATAGWYAGTGGMLRYGLQAGVTFGSNDIALRAGRLMMTTGDPPILPMYATVSYARRW